MSLRAPKDKMIKEPPSQKGFHFASDGIHEAMFVGAENIEEAQKIYHRTKKKLPVGRTESTAAQAAEQGEKEVE